MLKQRMPGVLVVAVMCSFVLSGCRRSEPDPVAAELARLVSVTGLGGPTDSQDPNVAKRAGLALSMYKNNVVDVQPVLIDAGLGIIDSSGQWYLRVALYDEDKDVLGWGISEEHRTSEGDEKTLVEEYPVFIHNRQLEDEPLRFFLRPVYIRDSNQRKDTHLWQRFCDEGKGPLESGAQTLEEYRRTLPPVYISIPEPNAVSVYIYDDAGHKSDPVRVRGNWRSKVQDKRSRQ